MFSLEGNTGGKLAPNSINITPFPSCLVRPCHVTYSYRFKYKKGMLLSSFSANIFNSAQLREKCNNFQFLSHNYLVRICVHKHNKIMQHLIRLLYSFLQKATAKPSNSHWHLLGFIIIWRAPWLATRLNCQRVWVLFNYPLILIATIQTSTLLCFLFEAVWV